MMIKLTIPGLLFHLLLGVVFSAYAQEREVYSRKPAFEFTTSKGLLLQVELLSDQKGTPIFYTAYIATEVCSDDLCKPIKLNVYWDLLGHFSDFKTTQNSPLTKFDHILFTEKDNQKLREILADDRSILKDYEAEDLIDRSIKVYSKKVDAVTGATNKSFEDVIVGGAVFTVHTLWHIVNGGVSAKIRTYTNGLLNDELKKYMLRSGRNTYQHYVLRELPPEKLKAFTPDMIALLSSKDEFVPLFALDKIPVELWKDPATQQLLLSHFGHSHLEIQNTLLIKFKDIKLQTSSLKVLLNNLDKLSDSQIDKIFNIMTNNTESIDGQLKKELSILSNHSKSIIAQRANELLKRIKE